jgi:hypothetical protein
MTPGPNLSAHVLGRWMFQFSRDPLTQEDLARSPDPRVCDGFTADRALDLGSDGVPRWWPTRNPDTLEWLTSHDRRKWFVRFFADQLAPLDERLLTCDAPTRRHIIAVQLFYLFAELDSANLPPPELS